MAIPNLFSRRQRLERGEFPDVYQYDSVPDTFRVQVWHMIEDALGEETYGPSAVEEIHMYVARELKRGYGIREISRRHHDGAKALSEFFFDTTLAEQALDIIELYFRIITGPYVASQDFKNRTKNHHLSPEEAVEDLNQLFKESGIGYQFEDSQLIRLDSAFLHAEAVRPTLRVLSDERFQGANAEFLTAHEHYRHGRYEACLVECCKAFESTMKTICTIREWDFKASDTAKNLINICFAKGLIPNYLESEMSSLRTLFESGIPTVRNKAAGHGQGIERRVVPGFLARYVLNLTATTILFLTEANASAEQA
ncbi:STM4504/CBY_0614 family protein [Massilia sp. GCM10023247]|uniref:STM4504/CBY_0614 family protein n=1 Tax=Massilia sp. GCM10023247 TaxID=3252643 RepID=UPI00360BC66F